MKRVVIDFDDVLVPTQVIMSRLFDLGVDEFYYDDTISKYQQIDELLWSGEFYIKNAFVLQKDLVGFKRLLEDKRFDVYVVTAETRPTAFRDKKAFLKREFSKYDWDKRLICAVDKTTIKADYRLDDCEDNLTDSESCNILYDCGQHTELEFDYKVNSIRDFYTYIVSTLNKTVTAYVDGSYNPYTNVYGSGVVYFENDTTFNPECIKFSGNDPSYVMSRQIPGEAMAAVYAVNRAVQEKRSKITLVYDYEGIAKWLNGEWKKATSNIGKVYKQIMLKLMKQIEVEFVWVNSHTGVELNELADKLAKEACGI